MPARVHYISQEHRPYQCHDLRRYFESKLVPIWVTFEHTCASHLASWDTDLQHIFNSIAV